MNLKFNKNKKLLLSCLVIFFIVFIIIIYMLFFKTKEIIKFNENYLSIEYGEVLDYQKLIKSVDPENAKIEFPDIEVKEVGTYHLTFAYNVDGKKGTQTIDVVVKDTKLPKVKIKNEKTVEVLVNSDYDIFTNISEIKNLSDQAKENRILISEDEYKKYKKQISEQNKLIGEREISNKKDIKESDVIKNCILYTSDFDASREGSYNIKMLFVDENYNVEEESWKIKVVPAGQIVNSGGTVSCVYPNDSLQTNEAYTTDYSEVYIYDESKLVSLSKFITTMTFKEDYDTDENINSLVSAINNKYDSYKKYEGVTIEVIPSATNVTTNIIVDFNSYDLENDPLNILEVKDSGKVKIENIINKFKDKATCELH